MPNFQNSEPIATEKNTVELMGNNHFVGFAHHYAECSIEHLARSRMEDAGPSFLRAGLKHQFGVLNAPLSSGNKWHL